ncbi:MAG: glycoside hydrolase family 44 protein [Terriglobales bacterium]
MRYYINDILKWVKAISSRWSLIYLVAGLALVTGCGGSGSSGGGGGGGNPPSAPTGLSATAGNQQVSLTWNASTGAASYNVNRGGASGGPYTTVASPTTTSYNDTAVTNGTTYYYVVTAVNTAGESGNSNQASATPTAPVACNQQLMSLWAARARATNYHVQRPIADGRGNTQRADLMIAGNSQTGPINGTGHYYAASPANLREKIANSARESATPAGTTSNVSVTVDVLANRHAISPYIYGGAFPQDATTITESGLNVVRWGGNAASTYNWKLFTNNADNDYYFEDYNFGALNNSADSNSTQFIKDVETAGSNPLMTMVMLPCVAQSQETSTTQGGADNYHWVFSVSQDKACSSQVDPYNTDAGINLESDCATTMVASSTQINRVYYPLLDGPPQAGDPPNSLYRNQWAAALATAFGSASTCSIPYFPSLTSCHFYDMDNEIDIWGGTHVDVHPNPSGYDELAATYWNEATKLKTWDPAAVRLGPVSCCWWFYWNGANGNDKGNHAGDDFLPWWLNQIHWQDEIANTRSLDIFDIHAYPDGPDTSGYSQAQLQALAVSIYRDYWDPTLVSPSGTIDQTYTTNIQPNKTIAFRIPRMRAIANMIYPGTPLSFTEWSAAFAGESDFSTALGDADAYGILGRERVSLSTRWTAPSPSNPNYLALQLYTKYNGANSFGTTSVSDVNTGDPNLFSSYAALDSTGKTLTVMVLNKDPQNTADVTFTLNGFTPSAGNSVTTYTLSQSPNNIVAGSPQAWSSTMTFQPYTATLLVISGSLASTPASDWDLNPDTIMVPASGTVTLQAKITSGTTNVMLSSAVFDSYEGAAACTGGSITLTTPTISSTQPGTITVNAGSTPGFCHFTATGSDGTVTQKQGGWIVVGNPAATITKTGDQQTGNTLTLTATLVPGASGGTASGATIFFSTNNGTLSQRLVTTDSTGKATVTLTLTSGTATVTAEGPYGLGHPVVTFTETAQ